MIPVKIEKGTMDDYSVGKVISYNSPEIKSVQELQEKYEGKPVDFEGNVYIIKEVVASSGSYQRVYLVVAGEDYFKIPNQENGSKEINDSN